MEIAEVQSKRVCSILGKQEINHLHWHLARMLRANFTPLLPSPVGIFNGHVPTVASVAVVAWFRRDWGKRHAKSCGFQTLCLWRIFYIDLSVRETHYSHHEIPVHCRKFSARGTSAWLPWPLCCPRLTEGEGQLDWTAEQNRANLR